MKKVLLSLVLMVAAQVGFAADGKGLIRKRAGRLQNRRGHGDGILAGRHAHHLRDEAAQRQCKDCLAAFRAGSEYTQRAALEGDNL